jgi:hypothetical protein
MASILDMQRELSERLRSNRFDEESIARAVGHLRGCASHWLETRVDSQRTSGTTNLKLTLTPRMELQLDHVRVVPHGPALGDADITFDMTCIAPFQWLEIQGRLVE